MLLARAFLTSELEWVDDVTYCRLLIIEPRMTRFEENAQVPISDTRSGGFRHCGAECGMAT